LKRLKKGKLFSQNKQTHRLLILNDIKSLVLKTFPKTLKEQANLNEGYFREQGSAIIALKIFPLIAKPDRLKMGVN